ncbi:MAG: hypothetical protein ACREJG_11385, partial [Candidatus Rokuibacteriota bacterium]
MSVARCSAALWRARAVELVRRHPDAAVAVALALLPVLVLGRALVPGQVLSPADNLLMFAPWAHLAPGVR